MSDTTRAQQIAQIVKAARVRVGLTQAGLAEQCSVHEQTIGNLERGMHRSTPKLLDAVGRILNVKLGEGALAAQSIVQHVTDGLVDRMLELSDAEQLMLAGDMIRFIKDWGDPIASWGTPPTREVTP